MDTNDYITLYLTDDGKSVPFGLESEKIPVEYFLKTATDSHISMIDGRTVLVISKLYNIHTLCERYEKLKTNIQEYENYMLTDDGRYLIFDSTHIPVDFIVQEAPGTVIINDTLKIPSKYNMDSILEKYKEGIRPKTTVTTPMNELDIILEEREKTHGDFRDQSYYAQSLKNVIKESVNYDGMSEMQKEALDVIAHKIGRILAGDPDFKDHWVDIEGYANLVSRDL